MKDRLWPLLVIFLCLIRAVSPVYPEEISRTDLVVSEEQLLDLLAGEEITRTTYDEYQFLFDHPVELNSASFAELMTLPRFNPELAEKIIRLRQKKRFSSLSGIRDIVGEDIFSAIRPLITVAKEPGVWRARGRISMTDDFEDDNQADIYVRLRSDYNKTLFFGLRGEAGEAIRGYDYHDGYPYAHEETNRVTLERFYLGVEGLALVEKLVLGDYSLRFGRGVTLNTARRRRGDGIFYNDSATERDRGLAASLKIGRYFYPSLFYSWLKRGYSVPAFVADQKTTRKLPGVYDDLTWGGRLEYRAEESKRIGYTFCQEKVERKFDFDITGFEERDRVAVSGFDFQYDYDRAVFGGEYSQIEKGDNAIYLEVLTEGPNSSINASYRCYPEEYRNPLGGGFANSDDEPNASDEIGYYLELENQLFPRYTLVTSFDQWRHPSSRIADREINASLIAQPLDILKTTVKYRNKDTDVLKSGYRYYYYSVKPRITLPGNVQLTLYYQLREYFNSQDELGLNDTGYGLLRLGWRDICFLDARLKFRTVNRLADNMKLARETYWQFRVKYPANFAALLKYTVSESLIPAATPTAKFKIRLDWIY